MRLLIDLEKTPQESDWNASVLIVDRAFVAVAITPEQAVANLLSMPEVQQELHTHA